jgi:hypothetical protein
MLTKDLPKGTMLLQRNGWKAKTMGSARGTTVVCEVYGDFTECGSIYTCDIVAYQDKDGNWKRDLEFTKSQLKCREMINSMGW